MFRSSLLSRYSNHAFSVTSGSARQLSPTNGCVSCRTLATLREKHKKYLKLVESHGAGSVTLTYDFPKQIATLSLSNESLRNAISGRMMNQLADTLDTLLDNGSKQKKSATNSGNAERNPVVGVILRCSGDIFSAGADLHLAKDIVNTSELAILMSQFMTDAFTRLRCSGFVSVCLINGSAVGGGAEIATVCDYRLMIDTPEKYICFIHAKIGASPGWGGASRLVSIVGRQKALRLLGTSCKVDVNEALSLGLIDGIVSASRSNTTTQLQEEDSIIPDIEESEGIRYNAALQASAESFLEPFIAQPFHESVAAVKILVASNDYLSKKHIAEMEQKIFGERWGFMIGEATKK